MLRSALLYFALVFATGFALGIARTLVVVPRVGDRLAELIEAPFMLVAIVLAARFVARRHRGPRFDLAVAGLLAAALVLFMDVVVGVGLRGMAVYDVLLGRDIVAGSVYYLLVAVFAVMPYLLAGPGVEGERGRHLHG